MVDSSEKPKLLVEFWSPEFACLLILLGNYNTFIMNCLDLSFVGLDVCYSYY